MTKWEDNFLEIYEFVAENEIDEFYASEISEEVGMNSPGKIGRSMYNVLDEYDLPISMERERPADPRLYIVEEFWELSEVEELLETEGEIDKKSALISEAKERLSSLEDQIYTDTELNQFLHETASKYYTDFSSRVEGVGKAKKRLQEEGLLKGNTHDGYRVVSD